MKGTITKAQHAKFNKALRSNNPAKALLNLSEELYLLDQNRDRDSLLEQFDLFSMSLKKEEDIELIYETMDVISGWCSPRRDAFLTEKENAYDSRKD